MEIKIVSKKQRRDIENLLKENFDLKLEFSHAFVRFGKDKIRLFTGDISEQDINTLHSLVRIDNIGSYFAFFKDNELRINFDVLNLFRKKVNKNILELNKEQAEQWMLGKNLEISQKFSSKIILIKYKDDLLGSGKISERLWNFVPKERRTNLIN
ncbi:MAG: hypothetical protein JSW08_02275 [archaeon]|nr:MAG: hypothetical protein JSW08_02275 [archaeon]